MDTTSQPVLINVALIGDASSGKSSLVTKLRQQEFHADIQTTVGVEIESHKVNPSLTLRIFDLAGQKRLQTFLSFLSTVDTVFITCDLTRADSLVGIEQHLATIKKYNTSNREQQIILVGTKSDLVDLRQIDAATLSNKATALGLGCIETSSLNGQGVHELFQLPINYWHQHKSQPDQIIKNEQVQIAPRVRSRGFFRDYQDIIAYSALFLAVVAIIVSLSTGIAAPLVAAFVAVGVSATLAAAITHCIAFVAGLFGGAFIGTAIAAAIDKFPWRQKKSAGSEYTPPTIHSSAGVLQQMGTVTHPHQTHHTKILTTTEPSSTPINDAIVDRSPDETPFVSSGLNRL